MDDKQPPEPLQIETALLTIPQVCSLLNISRAEFYRLDQSGKFAPLSVGLCKKRLYLRSEIEEWLRLRCPHRKQWEAIRTNSALVKL